MNFKIYCLLKPGKRGKYQSLIWYKLYNFKLKGTKLHKFKLDSTKQWLFENFVSSTISKWKCSKLNNFKLQYFKYYRFKVWEHSLI